MRQIKRVRCKGIFIWILAIGVLSSQIAADTTLAQEGLDQGGESIEEPAEPIQSPAPTQSAEPVQSPAPTQSAEPVQSPAPTQTLKPVKTPAPKALKKVSGVKLIRYATNAVKVTWKKQKQARYYRVYYSKKKSGSYQCAGITKDTHYLVKKLKNKTTYYFYVQACEKKKKSRTDSAPSEKVHMKTKTYRRKTVFAGDSICEAIGYPGWAYPYMPIGGAKKVIASVGLNTVTFHTKRVFNGRTGLQKLIAENPYRAYMMLGMNEVHYRKTDDMIAEYKSMIRAIQQACPDTDIVLCAVSPVTRAKQSQNSGFRQITSFNKKLKKLAKTIGVRYLDYTSFLKDSGGYLKTAYAAGDGFHWKMSAYPVFAKTITQYDKSLDR